ncbi:MAG: DUF1616 domain-containing protein [Candidatus Lokiarchaeota archaeon]|nr:DUF1616 domain-containing protein [Candidatus Lokiarchaeota archaeon]MBD3201490.1 DUF1616 domain-containing protein [Candidatus Lokiarchaeota archaeon]
MIGKRMSEEQRSLESSYKSFDKIVKISLIAGIIIVSGFIIYYIFTPEPPYHSFFILNEEEQMDNYPTNATVGQNVSFYLGVGNFLEKDLTFRFKILKGDENTTITSSGALNAVLNYTSANYTIQNSFTWISEKLTISFYEAGSRIIIAELYEITSQTSEKFLNILDLEMNISTT